MTAALMSQFGPAMFFWVLAVAHLLVAVYVLWRIMVREAVPVEEQGRYVPFPSRASRIATRLMPKRR